MGKFADAMRSVPMPDQTRRKVLTLDQEFSDMESEIQSLKAENLHLRADVKPLQREVEQLKERVRKTEEQKPDALTFNAHTGLHANAAGTLFCTTCYLGSGKQHPVQAKSHGWKCLVCGQFYSDPDWKPEVQRGGGPGSWMGR